jgi:hypothetical protein
MTNGVYWTKADARLIVDFSAVCTNLKWKLELNNSKRYLYAIRSPKMFGRTKHEARLLCEKFGIYGKKSTKKTISNLILSAAKNIIARFCKY